MSVLRRGGCLPRLATVTCCSALRAGAGGSSIGIGHKVCGRERRGGCRSGRTFGAAGTFDAVGGSGGGSGSVGVGVKVGDKERRR